LPGELARSFVIDAILSEGVVTDVAPEHGGHAELVRLVKGGRDLLDLPVRLCRPEVNRGTERDRPELPGFFYGPEANLIVFIGIREQLVVIDLADEGDLVGVLARDRTEHAERRRHRVAAALDRQLDDLLAVEVRRVRGEGRPGRVLDALVDRQDREIARARETAVVEERLQAAQHTRRTIAGREDPRDEVRPREVELRLRDRLALVLEQVLGVISEDRLEFARRRRCGGGHLLLLLAGSVIQFRPWLAPHRGAESRPAYNGESMSLVDWSIIIM